MEGELCIHTNVNESIDLLDANSARDHARTRNEFRYEQKHKELLADMGLGVRELARRKERTCCEPSATFHLVWS